MGGGVPKVERFKSRHRKPSGPPAPPNEAWGRAILLRRLSEDAKATAASICREYAGNDNISNMQRQISRWRHIDPDFRAEYDALMLPRAVQPRSPGPKSKEQLDPVALADWRQKFCTNLFSEGSRLKAAELSPFSYDYIFKLLDPKHQAYDREFAELVHLTEMRLCAEMEGEFVRSLREADDPRTRAWIAKQWLERRDATRWGRQVEMIHSGTIEHQHKLETRPRSERIAELLTDQKSFFAGSPTPRELSAAPDGAEAVLEADFVELVSQ